MNAVLTPKEREAWRLSLERSRPFGDDAWTRRTVSDLRLGHTIRREGRPKLERTNVEPAKQLRPGSFPDSGLTLLEANYGTNTAHANEAAIATVTGMPARGQRPE